MIDKRLLSLQKDKSYLMIVVGTRLVSLFISIAFYLFVSQEIVDYFDSKLSKNQFLFFLFMVIAFVIVKGLLNRIGTKTAFQASSSLRLTIRESIMKKVGQFGREVKTVIKPAELVQLSVEGVEQLEVYYARFIPQFFYSMIAALIVFVTLSLYRWQAALILLCGAFLIPVSIMVMVKIAKRILGAYWDSYLNLGDQFYENIKGLTTLKIYGQDQAQHQRMNQTAQSFRKATMRLLTMQLNSITIMDTIVYSGSAIGIALALLGYQNHVLSLSGVLLFIFLSAEFFIPLRQLGSLFHVAMTGMSASDRLFSFLDLEVQPEGKDPLKSVISAIDVNHLSYHYPGKNDALKDIDVSFNQGRLYAIVGESGSGKSTLASCLSGGLKKYDGTICFNGHNLIDIEPESFYKQVEYVSHQNYLTAGTLRDNLVLGLDSLSDEVLWSALRQVNLESFVLEHPQQLLMELEENGQNLSGGQRQRLLVARALCTHKSVYIFDEMTSSVDRESEQLMMKTFKALSKENLVIFISHRLYTVCDADVVLVLEHGRLVEMDQPSVLEKKSGYYADYLAQEQAVLQGKEGIL